MKKEEKYLYCIRCDKPFAYISTHWQFTICSNCLYYPTDTPRAQRFIEQLDSPKRWLKDKCEIPNCNWKHTLHIHHLIPQNDAGSNDEQNIMTLCPNHHGLLHKLIGTKTPDVTTRKEVIQMLGGYK